MSTRKPRGLREALARRQTNSTEYRLPIEELQVLTERKRELALAEQTHQAAQFLLSREKGQASQARVKEYETAVAKAKRAVDSARREYDACFYVVKFNGLPADEFDALVQLHPPTEEQVQEARTRGEEAPLWNDDTFYQALMERCAVSSELSAEEWAAELKEWPAGERKDIRARALEANVRSVNTALSFV